jgi:hypothetical protein
LGEKRGGCFGEGAGVGLVGVRKGK